MDLLLFILCVLHLLSFINIFFCHFAVAPGTYSPEKVNLEKGPQYSLTGKARVEKCNGTPGTTEIVVYILQKKIIIK